MTGSYRVVPLATESKRSAFDCGVTALNDYLAHQAGQDIKRHTASCWVAEPVAQPDVSAGFYTIAASGIAPGNLPEEVARKLPRYPLIPAARIGRLGVSVDHQGHGLGGVLLVDAIRRVVRSELAAAVIIVDAKDTAVAEFYGRFGFLRLAADGLALFLPVATAARLPCLGDESGQQAL